MTSKRKTWTGRVFIGRDSNGRQRFHWLGRFATKRERDDAVARARVERPWETAPPSELTGNGLVDNYLAEIERRVEARERKASTLGTVRAALKPSRAHYGDRTPQAQARKARRAVLLRPARAGRLGHHRSRPIGVKTAMTPISPHERTLLEQLSYATDSSPLSTSALQRACGVRLSGGGEMSESTFNRALSALRKKKFATFEQHSRAVYNRPTDLGLEQLSIGVKGCHDSHPITSITAGALVEAPSDGGGGIGGDSDSDNGDQDDRQMNTIADWAELTGEDEQ